MEDLEIPLEFYDHLPEKILDIEPHEIRTIFPHPSMVHLDHGKKETLFLSILLHGNEQSGFYVLKKVASHIKQHPPFKNIIIFIGNVYAAEQKKRYLHGQNDYNRVWQGDSSKEHRLAQKVLDWIKKQPPLFAAVDIHNNTGVNPYYACINELNNKHIYLASLFSKTIVYFRVPSTALSVALSKTTPTITLEVGQSRDPKGIENGTQLILDLLRLESLDHPVHKGDVNIYKTIAKVHLLPNIEASFSGIDKIEPGSPEVAFPDNFEQLNFTLLSREFCLARYAEEGYPVRVFDAEDVDKTEFYFFKRFDRVLVAEEIYPSMFTKNKEAIEQDCLGYFMKRLPYTGSK